MFWILNVLVFITVVLIFLALYSLLVGSKSEVSQRLSEIEKIKADESGDEKDELQLPFAERLLLPFFQNLGEKLGNLTPREIRNSIEKKIVYAGNPNNLNFNRFVTSQIILAFILFAIPMVLFSLIPLVPGRQLLLISILLGLGGFILPWIAINSKAEKRQTEIRKSLPDILDLLLVSVEAGLGFDMAIKRVSARTKGALSSEFNKAMEEIRMGRTREESLRGIVRRTGVQDLSSFITSVIQAEQLGTNIANTLRVQAETMRQRRRQRAEEAAMKAPIKMLFPLIFFIFPTIFVVILGPSLIMIIQVLGDFF